MNPVERWLASRSGTELRLQVLGALLLFEYTGYALINHLTVWRADTLGHNYLEPWSALDYAIPFVPAAILLYIPLLPMVAVPVFVLSEAKIRTGFWTYIGVIASSFAVFLLAPMKMTRAGLEPGALTPLFELMWAIDPPFNTFPSLHVSLATLAALVVWQHDPRLGRWMALGATVLTLSTFLVKQHFIIDAAGGVAVAALWYRYHYLPRARLK